MMKEMGHRNRIQRMLLRTFSVLLLFAGFSSGGQASDYGCRVMLCLGDPSGPQTQVECRPPIQRFLRERAEHRPPPMPTCEESNGHLALTAGYTLFDDCPTGTTALPPGELAVQGTASAASGTKSGTRFSTVLATDAVTYTGIGEQGMNGSNSFGGGLQKVCVGKLVGTLSVDAGGAQDNGSYSVNVYDPITTIDPYMNPAFYDVLVDGKPYRRVRF